MQRGIDTGGAAVAWAVNEDLPGVLELYAFCVHTSIEVIVRNDRHNQQHQVSLRHLSV